MHLTNVSGKHFKQNLLYTGNINNKNNNEMKSHDKIINIRDSKLLKLKGFLIAGIVVEKVLG